MLQRPTLLLVVSGLVVVACGGLDPSAFAKKKPSPSPVESAGWVFDAGSPRDAGGASGSMSSARGGAGSVGGRAGQSGQAGDVDDDSAGAGGDPDDQGGSSAVGGAGGKSTGGAGRGGSGGRGGTTPGGRAGAGGSSGELNGGAGASGGTAAYALYFSEYVEGSSSYKALEIRARADTALTGCRLLTYFNGSAAGSSIVLDAAVVASAPYVLCSSQLATLLGAVCSRTTNLTYNGDDAIALECGGVIIDVVGQIGVDPGDAWGSGDASTLNHTLRRRCPAAADPDGSNLFEPADAWDAFPVDTFDGLGRAESCD